MASLVRRACVGLIVAASAWALAAGTAGATQIGGPVTGQVQRVGSWLVDPQGRVVIFHGLNIVDKAAPYVPTNFSSADAELLAGEGFNAARLGIVWSGAEPEPGTYDDAYIGKVLSLDDLLGTYGIRTFLEMHQDLWGPSTGGDGAPAWATLSPTTDGAFAAFWADKAASDGIGIQTHYVQLWQHIAQQLVNHPSTIGIDPMNEPLAGSSYPGCVDFLTDCPAFESGALHDFYQGVITAIRSAGDDQVVFPESLAQYGALPAFSDPQTALSYHYYCTLTMFSSKDVAQPPDLLATLCLHTEVSTLGQLSSYAKKLDVPGFLGEFGGSDDNPDNAQQVDIADGSFTSWTEWAYYGAGQTDDLPGQGLLIDSSNPGSEANARQDKLNALAVPYAQAIAGTPLTTSLTRATKVYRLSYSTAAVPGSTLSPGAVTQVFIPARMYPTGYSVSAIGAKVVSAPGSPWLLLSANAGAKSVSVTVRSAAGTPTQTPLQTGVLPITGSAQPG
jgi:endoglycosylceramidase